MPNYASPAVLIAHTRSGGCYLNHCLSSHPQIFWPRGEPLLPGAEWMSALKGVNKRQILKVIMRAAHYKVGGCKITYEQMDDKIWAFLRQRRVKIIHLWRENMLRTVVSQRITGQVSGQHLPGHKPHTFKRLPPPEATVNIGKVLQRMRTQWDAIERMQEKLVKEAAMTGKNFLDLTYAQIVGGEGKEAMGPPHAVCRTICEFLGVREIGLTCELRRVHPYPLSLVLEKRNWEQLRETVAASEFAHCLEEEEQWTP